MTIHADFLRRQSRSSDTVVAAVADNCRFDERTSAARWKRFEDILPRSTTDPGAIDWTDWTEANRLHLDRYCTVPSTEVPDAFHNVNRDAWLDGPAEEQFVVRIEDLTRALQFGALSLPELRDLLQQAKTGDSDASRAVDLFIEAWNRVRDARPTFAAFHDEVQGEADDDDWPHALRDRLGLGHYSPGGHTPIAVALMRYSLADVFSIRNARGLPAACALPTVLDGGMHEFFFPVPREHPYGATVHLEPGLADTLTAEIVHCRIDYRRDHLFRLGEITRPCLVQGQELREARDLHLLALQVECDRADFGEPLEGRI